MNMDCHWRKRQSKGYLAERMKQNAKIKMQAPTPHSYFNIGFYSLLPKDISGFLSFT